MVGGEFENIEWQQLKIMKLVNAMLKKPYVNLNSFQVEHDNLTNQESGNQRQDAPVSPSR